VRPTDENQPSSRRPNLMSPARRTSGDIHILAMLDGRAAGRRMLARPRLLWYGAGGALACALLAVLAWLVRGTAPAGDAAAPAVAAVAPAVPAARTILPARTEQPSRTPRGSTAAPEAGSAPDVRGAVVVDVTPPVPAAPPAAVTAATSAARSAASVDLPAVRTGLDAASGASGSSHMPRIANTATSATPAVPAPPAAPARQLPPRRTRPRPEPSQNTRQYALQAPPPAHADARLARHKRSPAAARTPGQVPTSVDTDVALISAILQHAGTGTGSGAGGDVADAAPAASCADRSCGPRMPSR